MTNYRNKQNIGEEEIDLWEVFRILWDNKKQVIRVLITFIFLGIFISIFSETRYTASCIIIPKSLEKGSAGNLGNLVEMTGVKLKSKTGVDIALSLYPNIIQSKPFKLAILETPINIAEVNKKITLRTYYEEYYHPSLLGYVKKYTLKLPYILINSLKDKHCCKYLDYQDIDKEGILKIRLEDKELLETINNIISIDINTQCNYIKLSATMPEALASAQLTKNVQNLLQKTITKIKTEQITNELSFIERRFNEKKKEAEAAQLKLARFKDKNRNVTTATARIEIQRLQAEYAIIYNVYSELAKQLETKKIQVTENTSVFSVIDPVAIPLQKSAPRYLLILVLFTFLGGISGITYVLIKTWLPSILKNLDFVSFAKHKTNENLPIKH